jgi:alkylhydroperoxidase family enzyme
MRVALDVLRRDQDLFNRAFGGWRTALASCRGWEERGLIATVVSQANLAHHCVTGHRERAVARLSEREVEQALDDAGRGSITLVRAALLEFAEQLTVAPEELSPEKVGRAVAAGASVDRLRDAVEVTSVMNVVNRITTTLDVSRREVRSGARS